MILLQDCDVNPESFRLLSDSNNFGSMSIIITIIFCHIFNITLKFEKICSAHVIKNHLLLKING